MQIQKSEMAELIFDHKSSGSKWILKVSNLNLQLGIFNKMAAKPFDAKSALWLSTSNTWHHRAVVDFPMMVS